MGQRLNIEITDGCGVALANCYYHWSAYTSCSINLIETIIEANEDIKCNSLLERAVKLLEQTGGGINDFERTRIENNTTGEYEGIEFKACIDRNNGLISVTEAGIADTRKWEEGRIEIDIENRKINFYVYWGEDVDNYISRRFEDIDVSDLSMNEKEAILVRDGMPSVRWQWEDFEEIPFEEFYKVAELVDDNEYGFYTPKMMVFTWIC